ncbi:MAG: AAA family ATPase [Chitinivibrionales bacterium]|nr:AAA family ATPase [Chitinivibrionales bacterium]
MRQDLVFVGGPPGVGKTTTCTELGRILPDSIWVDADDLWCRMNPFRADDVTIPMIERNIVAVLGNFLDAGFRHVVLCWVLHRREIIDGLLAGLADRQFRFHSYTLVCDETVLKDRWELTHKEGSGFGQAVVRLEQLRALPHTMFVDTSDMTAVQAASVIAGRFSQPG